MSTLVGNTYVQASSNDPGGVGFGFFWAQNDTGLLYIRNTTNSAWTFVGNTGITSLGDVSIQPGPQYPFTSGLVTNAQIQSALVPVFTSTNFTATAGQTLFSPIPTYTPGATNLSVYLNGSRLALTLDYTETSATSFTLIIGAQAGDSVVAVTGQNQNGYTTASMINFAQPLSGAVVQTVQTKLQETINALDFGADPSGAVNATAGLVNFYNACITTGRDGYIPGGTYKITPGTLIFNSAQTNKPWPNIRTADNLVVFSVDPATNVNAPILQWTNGVSSGSTYQWLGGSHGGITIIDATGQTAPLRCGVSLQGWRGPVFPGRWAFYGLPGDAIKVPYGATYQDQYAVNWAMWDMIDANNCTGYAINNLGMYSMDSWKIKALNSNQNLAGGVFGLGDGTWIGDYSCSGPGWAIDDGTQAGTDNPGFSWGAGPVNRNVIDVAEFDTVQYGVRLNKASFCSFKKIRITYRYQGAFVYWPLTSFDICGGSNSNVNNCDINVWYRIEAGGLIGNLNPFTNMHNSGQVTNFQMDNLIQDDAALGVGNAQLVTGYINSATVRVSKSSEDVVNTLDRPIGLAYGSNAVTVIVSGGFGTSASKVPFASVPFSPYSSPLTVVGGLTTFTAPRNGLYQFGLQIPMTLTVGTRVRLGFWDGTYVHGGIYAYQVNAGIQTYLASCCLYLNSGATINPMADTNLGSSSAATPFFQNDEVQFSVRGL